MLELTSITVVIERRRGCVISLAVRSSIALRALARALLFRWRVVLAAVADNCTAEASYRLTLPGDAGAGLITLYVYDRFVGRLVVRVVLADNLTGDDLLRRGFVRNIWADFGPQSVHLTAMRFKLLVGRLQDPVEFPQRVFFLGGIAFGRSPLRSGLPVFEDDPVLFRALMRENPEVLSFLTLLTGTLQPLLCRPDALLGRGDLFADRGRGVAVRGKGLIPLVLQAGAAALQGRDHLQQHDDELIGVHQHLLGLKLRLPGVVKPQLQLRLAACGTSRRPGSCRRGLRGL
ncbi:hypothetical protein ACFYRN_38705 [Streptomyces sp. NPDC005227]|uniref:hypothetical protein n=1 Tax=Streptomyces sp. NPDC005227 TaxID=3364707 RepID=UPI00367858D3